MNKEESANQAAHIRVTGRVQGVGYRVFAKQSATLLHLVGYVRNMPDESVEAMVEGPKNTIEEWIAQLRKGPIASNVVDIHVVWLSPAHQFNEFTIDY